MADSDSDLDWSEAKSWIGRNLLIEPRAGADAVDRSSIRRQLEVLEMDCPLHYDEDVARENGYEGIFAPYHMLMAYFWPPWWKPGMESRWTSDEHDFWLRPINDGKELRVPTPTPRSTGFVTDAVVEFYKPLYVGEEVIASEDILTDVNPRKTRVGDGAFMTHEVTYVNQHGEKVAKWTMTSYTYVPFEQPDTEE